MKEVYGNNINKICSFSDNNILENTTTAKV